MRIGLFAAVLALSGGGCGDSGGGWGYEPRASDLAMWGARADMAPGRSCLGANDCAPGHYCNVFGVCVEKEQEPMAEPDAGPPPTPPEVEARVETPAIGKRHVYVAVAAQDTVVKVDSQSLKLSTITVGKDPGALRTAPGQDVAIVLNRQSATAMVLRSKDDGGDTVITLPTVDGLNQLVMSPDGRHAVAFFDLTVAGGNLIPKQTFQEVTLLALEAGKEQAVNLSVGFRPSEVQFAADGQAVHVITEEGVSSVRLTPTPKPSIVPTVPVLKDPLTEAVPDEVLVTRDGRRALARLPKQRGIRVVDLQSRGIVDLDLGAEATDLDLTDDGTLAVVTMREPGEVAFVDVPGDFQNPAGVERVKTAPYRVGQSVLTRDGGHAFLFTNAENEEVLLDADLRTRKVRALKLKKGVRQVYPSTDGKTLVIVHNRVPGTPTPQDTLDEYLDKHEAFGLLAVDSGYVKLVPVDAPPGPIAFAPDQRSAYLLLSSAAVRTVEAIDLVSFLTRSVGLASPPVAVGVVPSTRQVYVAQDHPLGRMTFVDAGTGKTRTLTGFALNSQIIE